MALKLSFWAFLFLITPFGMKLVYADLTQKEILVRGIEAKTSWEGLSRKVHISTVENQLKQERVLDVKVKGFNYLATILSPPEEKGYKFLMVNRDMWFFKAGLKRPAPMSPRQLLLSGVTFGDLANVDYSKDYEATLLPEQVIGDELCYVFDLKAIDQKSTYPLIKYWVSKKRLVGVRAELFLVSGKMTKSAMFEHKYVVLIKNQPHPFLSKTIITDALINQNVSTITFSEPTFLKIPDSTFDVKLLKLD